MRKIIISFCILLAALSLKAQPVSGIRIDGGDTPILVYFGGRQMCYPTTTCFVANLNPAYVYTFVFKGLKCGIYVCGYGIGSLLGSIRRPFNWSILFTWISP